MIGKLILAIKTVKQVYGFIKNLDKQGAERFSDEWAHAMRDQIEGTLYRWSQNPDKGWRKHIKSEDQLLRAAQIIMKSGYLQKKLDKANNK